MSLRVVGAGLPRTGTQSLSIALRRLLGAPCFHMREIVGHPYVLGEPWETALRGGAPDWARALDGYVATVDWPASLFWRGLADTAPDALVLLSDRHAESWLASMEATVLPVARAVAPADWIGGRDIVRLLELFTGTPGWDDPAVLLAARDRWLASVRADADPDRLVEWTLGDGWEPLCAALDVRVPDEPFPWANRRQDWPL